jgi:hypothetical protein
MRIKPLCALALMLATASPLEAQSVPQLTNCRLEWDFAADPTLAYFRIYIRPESGQYGPVNLVVPALPVMVTQVDCSKVILTTGLYAAVIAAVDMANLESGRSNEIHFQVGTVSNPTPPPASPTPPPPMPMPPAPPPLQIPPMQLPPPVGETPGSGYMSDSCKWTGSC